MADYRIIWIVLDSVGIGALPDAKEYNDEGSNTLVNTAKAVGGLNLPNLQKLGLGNLDNIEGVPPVEIAEGVYGTMKEKSKGKDSTTGHWEMAGLITHKPFPTYPHGFPEDVIEEFEKRTGRKVIGNKPASGTVIIKELGREHERTGTLIVYTSADSVFQIAAHEDIVPVKELYRYCEIAREILKGEHGVARVIARPFIGKWPNYVRTANRRDFSIRPPEPTVLNILVENGYPVYAVGKIYDLFGGSGITKSIHTENNMDGVDKTIKWMEEKDCPCLIFTNLVDFDMRYGHRNDYAGYAKALENFDKRLPDIESEMTEKDILVMTADHGCDPTTPSTDHSRERVPLLITGKSIKKNTYIGERETFADLGQTAAEMFSVPPTKDGVSFAKKILKFDR
ncbi:MAG: phosphopentomutase [Thermotoga sp.]|nr:MAG: phosphopentomutase [Thermotoga sp.]